MAPESVTQRTYWQFSLYVRDWLASVPENKLVQTIHKTNVLFVNCRGCSPFLTEKKEEKKLCTFNY